MKGLQAIEEETRNIIQVSTIRNPVKDLDLHQKIKIVSVGEKGTRSTEAHVGMIGKVKKSGKKSQLIRKNKTESRKQRRKN